MNSNKNNGPDDTPPLRLTVVIPTLNEEAYLPALLDSLARQSSLPDAVIVADAGSTDRTLALAEAGDARVVHAPRGRGRQVATALATLADELVLVAHADMVLAEDAVARVREALRKPSAIGGSFGTRFDDASLFLRGIAWLNNQRARFTGISFGDQGQFFHRARLATAGGYPDLLLMEDVELSLRFRRGGRPLYLGPGVLVSARTWRSKAKGKHALLVIWLVAKYVLLRTICRGPVDVTPFYRAYYGRNPDESVG